TKEEDELLADIVLGHIRSGKTQLEAFRQAGEALSRTPAACGFRWNASIRKQYAEAIDKAKNSRKQTLYEKAHSLHFDEQHTIESAISMLEKMKENVSKTKEDATDDKEKIILQLKEENGRLEDEIKRYREAWTEMKNIWEWIENKNEH